MGYNFEIPSKWKELSEDKYKILGFESIDDIVCLASFIAHEENENCLVSYISYTNYKREFLVELDKSIANINELNELIDGNPEDEKFENTSVILNIFHGFNQTENGEFYISINKIKVNKNEHKYTFQIFTEAKNGILCVQITLSNIDENNAVESSLSTNVVSEAVKILLSLKNIK